MIDMIQTYWPIFLEGTGNTILISFYAVCIGLVFGTLLALMRLAKHPVLHWFAVSYIQLIRGTPLLVQLFIIYFGLTNLNLSSFMSGVIAVGMNAMAYVAEIVRGGIQAVDNGQMEAARALGLSHVQAMRYVIMPQAFRSILPAIGNEFSALIKETAIVSYLGIKDLMFSSDLVRGATYTVFGPLFVVAAIYFILTSVIAMMVAKLEHHLNTAQ